MQARVIIPHSSGLPRNEVNNTFALIPKGSATRASATTAFTAAIGTFYNTIKDSLSSEMRTTQMHVEYVDLADPRPRIPYDDVSIATATNPATTNFDLPPEVALCLSMRGAPGSGVNIRRRRGRVYIGQLQTNGTDAATASTSLASQITGAFGPVMVDPAYELCIYSRYTHYGVPVGSNINDEVDGERVYDEQPEALPAAFTPVTAAWVDNAWDTQRRRGTAATTRSNATPS